MLFNIAFGFEIIRLPAIQQDHSHHAVYNRLGAAGVNCRQDRMAGHHRIENIEHLISAAFGDDEPIGIAAKSVSNQLLKGSVLKIGVNLPARQIDILVCRTVSEFLNIIKHHHSFMLADA